MYAEGLARRTQDGNLAWLGGDAVPGMMCIVDCRRRVVLSGSTGGVAACRVGEPRLCVWFVRDLKSDAFAPLSRAHQLKSVKGAECVGLRVDATKIGMSFAGRSRPKFRR